MGKYWKKTPRRKSLPNCLFLMLGGFQHGVGGVFMLGCLLYSHSIKYMFYVQRYEYEILHMTFSFWNICCSFEIFTLLEIFQWNIEKPIFSYNNYLLGKYAKSFHS